MLPGMLAELAATLKGASEHADDRQHCRATETFFLLKRALETRDDLGVHRNAALACSLF
jgi:hypothetical protein